MSDLKDEDRRWVEGLNWSVKVPVRVAESLKSSPWPESDVFTLRQALVASPKREGERPVNFHEISEKEFAQSIFVTEPPVATEVRSFSPEDGEPHTYFTLTYMVDGTGFTMGRDYWEGRVRFFAFGCKHSWGSPPEDHPSRAYRLGRCENITYCTSCGYWSVVDSSD